jgi:hypothetical protein
MDKIAAYEMLISEHPLWNKEFEKQAIFLSPVHAASVLLPVPAALGAAGGALAAQEGERGMGALRGAAAGAAAPLALLGGIEAASRLHPSLRNLRNYGFIPFGVAPVISPLVGFAAQKKLVNSD